MQSPESVLVLIIVLISVALAAILLGPSVFSAYQNRRIKGGKK